MDIYQRRGWRIGGHADHAGDTGRSHFSGQRHLSRGPQTAGPGRTGVGDTVVRAVFIAGNDAAAHRSVKRELACFLAHYRFRRTVKTLYDALGDGRAYTHPDRHCRNEDVATLDLFQDFRPFIAFAFIVGDAGQYIVVGHPDDFGFYVRFMRFETFNKEIAKRFSV